jgi:lysophospholipase L1-like esterase
MKRLLASMLSLFICAPLSLAQPAATEKPKQPVVAVPPKKAQDPAVAAPKLGRDGEIEKGFAAAHERFLKRTKEGPIDILFLGDSITAGWAGAGKAVWAKTYGDKNAANFGIGGDRTEHVLWRITNGELEGIKPKVVVLMIGTNNTGGNDAASIANGVTKIVETIRTKLPETKVMLLGVFPRAPKADSPARAKIKQINEIIAKLDDGKMVRYLDIGQKFLTEDGTLTKEIMPDALHPNAAGYQIWADAIAPLLAEMTK